MIHEITVTPPQKPTVTLTITLNEEDILAIAGEDDWLWENCVDGSRVRDRVPSPVQVLYWAIRDTYNLHLRD